MTLPHLLATLHRRVAASHTTGGIESVAKELGVSKQTLGNIINRRHVPTARTQALIISRLTQGKRKS